MSLSILIIEDSPEKLKKIVDVIDSCTGVLNPQIFKAKNVAESSLLLQNLGKIDLLILDLNLPIREGEETRKDSGLTLLKDIIRYPAFTKPEAIIGLTAYDEVKKLSLEIFNREGWTILSYNPKFDEWRDTIRNKIAYLHNKKTLSMSLSNEYHLPIFAVLFTALSKELKAVRNFLSNPKDVIHSKTGTSYIVGEFQNKGIALFETGVGNVISGIEAERALQFFNPNFSIFIGIGGGLKDVIIGDVVIATKVYGYESGKDDDIFFSRANYGQSDYSLEQIGKQISRDDEWLNNFNSRVSNHRELASPISVYVAPIAAGEKVVSSKKSETYIKIKTFAGDSLAVAMEEYGFLEASKAHPNIKCIVIRGISDLIEKKSESDLQGSQELAALCASEVAFELLKRISK